MKTLTGWLCCKNNFMWIEYNRIPIKKYLYLWLSPYIWFDIKWIVTLLSPCWFLNYLLCVSLFFLSLLIYRIDITFTLICFYCCHCHCCSFVFIVTSCVIVLVVIVIFPILMLSFFIGFELKRKEIDFVSKIICKLNMIGCPSKRRHTYLVSVSVEWVAN